jgi:hypothetical protein
MGVRSVNNTLQSFLDTFLRSGTDASGREAVFPFSATGGNQTPSLGIVPGNGYRYHIFTSSGNFVVSNLGTSGIIEVLMVAGGGGAGNPLSAGGGAGGVVYHAALPTSVTTYPISVGGGGAGSSASTPASGPTGLKGTPTTAFGMIAEGGGGGGPYDGTVPNLPDMSGGSGGGGRSYSPPFTGGTGTQPTFNAPFVPNPQFAQYGNPGASSPTITDPLGQGGGGAGAAGSGQAGGNGRPFPGFAAPLIAPVLPAPVQSEIGPTGLYGGGGAGGARNSPALGGSGGGGNSGPGWVGESGFQFTGGGGGGGMYSPSSPTLPTLPPAAAGGSGIVIIRYLA